VGFFADPVGFFLPFFFDTKKIPCTLVHTPKGLCEVVRENEFVPDDDEPDEPLDYVDDDDPLEHDDPLKADELHPDEPGKDGLDDDDES
jgi:hypothetical protein